jgi:two-component system sensor histidine kinase YesM
MNRVSVDVAFSREVGESFARLRAATSPSNRYNVRLALNQLLFGVIGPMLPVYQVNLFDLAGEGVGAGFAGVTPRLPAQGSDWRREALAREGARFITAPFPDPDDPTAGPLISLCRLYFDRSNARVGYIEVQQRADAVFASAREAVPVPDGFRAATRVVVLDGQGALLYPLAGSADEAVRVWADRLRSASQDRGTLSLRDPSTGARYLVARAGSELTGWTVAVIDSEQVLLSPVSSFTRGVAVAGVGAVLLVLFISYLLARRFGAPIAALSASVRSLTLSGAAVRAREPSSGIEELDALSASFAQMRARLGESVEQLVRSRSLELRARMLALQSQMNPHFLYNTISTIGALAEDGRSTEIAGMCDELSRMLRYVSAAEPAEVTLAEEIEHTRHFLGLMRHRYEEQVSWSIDIPRDLLEIPVPRLSVQPLVENSLKHGIHVPPPWKVTVSAERRDGRWFVSVADNGAGFT